MPEAVRLDPFQNIIRVGWNQPFCLLGMVFPHASGIDIELEVDDGTVSIATSDGHPATDPATGRDYLAIISTGTFTSPNDGHAPYPFEDEGGSLGNAFNLVTSPQVFEAAGVIVYNPNPNDGSEFSDHPEVMQASLDAHNIGALGGDGAPFEDDPDGGYWRLAVISGGEYTWSYADSDEDGTIVLPGTPFAGGSQIVPGTSFGSGYTFYVYKFWDPNLADHVNQWALAYIDPRLIFQAIQSQSAQPLSYFVKVDIKTGGGNAEDGSGGGSEGSPFGHFTMNSQSAFEEIDNIEPVDNGEHTPEAALAALRLVAGLKSEGDFDLVGGATLTGALIRNVSVVFTADGIGVE